MVVGNFVIGVVTRFIVGRLGFGNPKFRVFIAFDRSSNTSTAGEKTIATQKSASFNKTQAAF